MKILLLLCLILFSLQTFAQVGINTTGAAPTPSAMLDVSSTNKGILIPRMTTTQKNAIPNKVEGLMVYDTDLKLFSYWIVGAGAIGYWMDFPQNITPTPNYWALNGSDISNYNTGNVGIGITNPTIAKLQVVESNTNQPVHSAIWANNTSNGNGITGNAFNAGIGVWGTSGTGTGVEGRTTGNTANSYGVFGNATGSGTGGYFYSGSGASFIANGTATIGSNSSPDPSAILDINSTSKGLLIPRLTSIQRNEIINPATGLFVFDLDVKSLYYFNGQFWKNFLGDTHVLGESYGGGIIYYVTPNGKHGLIAATHDQVQVAETINVPNPSANWYSTRDNVIDPTKHNNEGKNYTDWRVPTRNELERLYINRNLVGGFTTFLYWCATETMPSNFGIVVSFGQIITPGSSSFTDKTGGYNLRAIRSF